MTIPEQLRLVMAVVALINCLIFMIGYHVKRRGDWRHYPMGRHLMYVAGTLAILMLMLVLSLAIGPLGPWPWIGGLALLIGVLTQRNLLLFKHRPVKGDEGPSDDTVQRTRR